MKLTPANCLVCCHHCCYCFCPCRFPRRRCTRRSPSSLRSSWRATASRYSTSSSTWHFRSTATSVTLHSTYNHVLAFDPLHAELLQAPLHPTRPPSTARGSRVRSSARSSARRARNTLPQRASSCAMTDTCSTLRMKPARSVSDVRGLYLLSVSCM